MYEFGKIVGGLLRLLGLFIGVVAVINLRKSKEKESGIFGLILSIVLISIGAIPLF